MDLSLTDDQKMIKETAANFVKKESPVERARELRETELGYDDAIYQQMGELGWLGLPLPEAVGGFGGDMVDVSILIEEFGKSLVPEPYLASVILGGMAVVHGADTAQQRALLGPLAEGTSTLSLAWAERGSRYSVTGIETTAEPSGDTWKLSGEKIWALGGHAADQLIVSAKTEAGVSLFAVARGASGLTVDAVKTMDGQRAATVRLEGAQGQLLGEDGAGAPAVEHALDKGAAAACAEGVGITQAVLSMTVEYLKERRQFGVPIGIFQALQHRAVDMFVQAELLKGTSILANANADDTDVRVRRPAVSAAKAMLSSGGFSVVAEGTQLHGGVGVTDEHDISLFFKRMRVLMAICGDETHHIARYMREGSFTEGL